MISFAAFADELEKLSAVSAQRKLEHHFSSEQPDWRAFNKNMKRSKFRDAAAEHPFTDEKLKRYVQNYGGMLASKERIGRVRSSSFPNKLYTIKKLPDGRLACNCRDWQYVHSVAGTNCKHIEAKLKARKAT